MFQQLQSFGKLHIGGLDMIWEETPEGLSADNIRGKTMWFRQRTEKDLMKTWFRACRTSDWSPFNETPAKTTQECLIVDTLSGRDQREARREHKDLYRNLKTSVHRWSPSNLAQLARIWRGECLNFSRSGLQKSGQLLYPSTEC